MIFFNSGTQTMLHGEQEFNSRTWEDRKYAMMIMMNSDTYLCSHAQNLLYKPWIRYQIKKKKKNYNMRNYSCKAYNDHIIK